MNTKKPIMDKYPDPFVDFFNQPIGLDSKLLVPVSGRLKVCSVVKLNRKSIVVKELDFKDGGPIRATPKHTVLLSGEEMTLLALLKGYQL